MLCSALELFLSAELYAQCDGWTQWDSLDGVIASFLEVRDSHELQLAGMAILMSQETLPIHVRLRANEGFDELDSFHCRLGETDAETGALLKVPYRSRKYERQLTFIKDELDEVDWHFECARRALSDGR